MKTTFKTIVLIFLTSVLFQSCSKDDLTFQIVLENINACVPGNIHDVYHLQWTTVDQDDIKALFSQNGVEFNFSDIKDVTLNEATVELVSPTGGNLNDIQYIDIYFKEVGSTTDSTKVAYVTTIPDNAVKVTLENQFSDLDEFLNKPQFEVGLKIFRQVVGTEVCVEGTLRLNVKVKQD